MKIKSFVFTALLGFCFIAYGNNSRSSSQSDTQISADAIVINANSITKITPTELIQSQNSYINEWVNVSTLSTSINPLAVCSKTNNYYSNDIDINVSTLQSIYNDHFCQLNSSISITMDTAQCQQNIAFIKNQAATGNFDLNSKPIQNNKLGIQSVKFVPVAYNTTVQLPSGNQTFSVSGGLIMPNIDKSKIKGVAVYFHGTTSNNTSVGSNWCNPETQLVAAVFASQGYIVVMPDYIGQGVNWQSAHPYILYPQVSAKTAVDMLTSVQQTIQNKYSLTSSDTLKLYSFGYSEGGAYSLWFNTYLRANPTYLSRFYNLSHSVGAEGAYNTSNVIKNFLFDNVSSYGENPYNIQNKILTNIFKPVLSADALLSYATYSINMSKNGQYEPNSSGYTSVLNPDFFNLNCFNQSRCNVNGVHMNIATAYAEQNQTVIQPVLSSSLGKSNEVNGKKYQYPNLFTILLPFADNNISSLVSSTFFNTNQMSQLDATLKAADVNLTNIPNGSVSIISLTKDSVVSPNNFTFLSNTYPSKFYQTIAINPENIQVRSLLSGNNSRNYVNVDHLQAAIYEYLYILNIFNNK